MPAKQENTNNHRYRTIKILLVALPELPQQWVVKIGYARNSYVGVETVDFASSTAAAEKDLKEGVEKDVANTDTSVKGHEYVVGSGDKKVWHWWDVQEVKLPVTRKGDDGEAKGGEEEDDEKLKEAMKAEFGIS